MRGRGGAHCASRFGVVSMRSHRHFFTGGLCWPLLRVCLVTVNDEVIITDNERRRGGGGVGFRKAARRCPGRIKKGPRARLFRKISLFGKLSLV